MLFRGRMGFSTHTPLHKTRRTTQWARDKDWLRTVARHTKIDTQLRQQGLLKCYNIEVPLQPHEHIVCSSQRKYEPFEPDVRSADDEKEEDPSTDLNINVTENEIQNRVPVEVAVQNRSHESMRDAEVESEENSTGINKVAQREENGVESRPAVVSVLTQQNTAMHYHIRLTLTPHKLRTPPCVADKYGEIVYNPRSSYTIANVLAGFELMGVRENCAIRLMNAKLKRGKTCPRKTVKDEDTLLMDLAKQGEDLTLFYYVDYDSTGYRRKCGDKECLVCT